MKETCRNLILHNAFKVGFAVSMVLLFLYIMVPFIIPIVMGGIFAMALIPFVEYLVRKGLSRDVSLVIMSVTLGLLLLTPAVFFFMRGSRMVSEMMANTDMSSVTGKVTTTAYSLIDSMSKDYGIDNSFAKAKFNSYVASFGKLMARIFSDFFVNLPEVLLAVFITMLSAYCCLKEAGPIRRMFDRYFYFTDDHGDEFVKILKVCCQEVFITNIITGVLQACVVSIGALICGVGDFFLVFFLTFIVSFIPIIGAGPVAAALAVICFVEGKSGSGVGMLVVAGVAGISDNAARPFMASLGTVYVHPFIALLAVIGGVVMFGLPGLFIGPLVASVSLGAVPIIIEEYYPRVKAKDAPEPFPQA